VLQVAPVHGGDLPAVDAKFEDAVKQVITQKMVGEWIKLWL